MGHLEKKYTRKYYLGSIDNFVNKPYGASGFDSFKQGQIDKRYKIFLKNINFKDKVILDIGCGRGEMVKCCAERGAEKVIGIDFSSEAISLAKNFNKIFKNVELLQMEAKDIKFKNFFDYIFMLDTIEHIPDEEMQIVYPKILSALKYQGIFILDTPIYKSPNDKDTSDYIPSVSGMHCNKQTIIKINHDLKRNKFRKYSLNVWSKKDSYELSVYLYATLLCFNKFIIKMPHRIRYPIRTLKGLLNRLRSLINLNQKKKIRIKLRETKNITNSPGTVIANINEFFNKRAINRSFRIRIDPIIKYEQKVRQNMVFSMLDLKFNEVILDIGCGNARDLVILSKSKNKCFGIDLSYNMLKEARKSFAENSLKKINIAVCNATKLSFPNDSFDKVVFSEVAEHIPDFVNAIDEISRVLKKGGVLIMTVPNRLSMYGLDRYFIREKLFNKKWRHPYDLWKNYNELEINLKKKNFKIIRYSGICYIPGFIIPRRLPINMKNFLTMLIEKIEPMLSSVFPKNGYMLAIKAQKLDQ